MDRITLTRKDFYDLIWSTPMTSLAKKYDISDSGLRKMAIRMEIPLPKAGHWEKLRARKKVERFRLSDKYTGEPTITLSIREETMMTQHRNQLLMELRNELESDPGRILVPGRLTSVDKRITGANDSMRGRAGDNRSGLMWTDRGQLDIKVAPLNISRALRFMDALIRWLEKRGHAVETGESTHVLVANNRMKILLRERTKKEGVTRWGSPEYVPTGEFYFKLDDYPSLEWKDGKKTLEEQLPAIVARLEIQGKKLLDVQQQWKRDREESDRRQRVIQEIEDRKEKELNDFKNLLKDAARWQKVKLLRDYIQGVESLEVKNNTLSEQLSGWLSWAKDKLDWYDPSIAKDDEFLKEVDKETLEFIRKPYSFSSDEKTDWL